MSHTHFIQADITTGTYRLGYFIVGYDIAACGMSNTIKRHIGYDITSHWRVWGIDACYDAARSTISYIFVYPPS